MFEATFFMLSIIPILFFIVFGIPIIIGILVYRDASKRIDCSPWLWALIAALVPSFIGLIIYAIIRRDYPLKPEYRSYADGYTSGGAEQASYEQAFDENGSPIPVKNPHRGFPTWAKVLLILGAVLIVVGMIAGCGAAVSALFGYHTPGGIYYEF